VLVTISSRHMDVTPALKAFAEQKVSKLTRYYDRIQEIEVIFDNAKGSDAGGMIASAEHRKYVHRPPFQRDAYACVDGCMSKLERQLSEHKKKFRNRKHMGGEDKRDMKQAGAPGSSL